MRIITRHLLAQLGAALLLGLLLLVGLVWALQALRLGHHLALGGAPLGRLLLWSAPTLLVFALPLALAAAVLLTFGRLAETNQLLALRAAGASPLQLATPALLLSVLAGLAAGLTALELEPPALRALRVTAGEVAARALLQGLRPGQFHQLSPELTLHAEEVGREGGALRLRRLFLARREPALLLLAEEASARLEGSSLALVLELRRGELHAPPPTTVGASALAGAGPPALAGTGAPALAGTGAPALAGTGAPALIRFERSRLSFDLWPALRPHLGFLAQLAASRDHAATAPAACLALGVLGAWLGLGRGSRGRRALAALGGVVTYQVGAVAAAALGGRVGAVCWSLAVVTAGLLALARGRP